jgi:hypothetical protein
MNMSIGVFISSSFFAVRYMSIEGMKRKFDSAGYISKYGVHPA